MKITYSKADGVDLKQVESALDHLLDSSGESEDKEIARALLRDMRIAGRMPNYFTGQELQFLQHHPTATWASYLIFRYKFTVYPTQHRLTDFPTYILIEPVSSCNFRCPMCFQVDRTFTRKPFMGTMDMGLFRQVIDEAVAGGTGAITIASRGEPTLHPRLTEMLQYASGKFFELKLNTNASKLTSELAHAILASELTNLVFSVDAHTKALYERIRVGGIFEDVQENIENFHRIRDTHYPNSSLVTRISGVQMMKDQEREQMAFTEYWSKVVDQVALVKCEERWDVYKNPIRDDVSHPCRYIWERLYVWFDGICNPCDVDYKSTLSPGKIGNGVSIRDVWTSEAYSRLRNTHMEHERVSLKPCDRCGI